MKRSFLILFFFAEITIAQVPQTLNYQGILTDQNGVVVPDNIYSLTFKLYDVLSGGSALWEETQSSSVLKGLFNVILGKVTPINLPFDKQYYLSISIGGNAELQPRTELTSSGYSLISRSVSDNSITTAKISDGAVTQNKLASGISLPPGGTAGGDLSGTFPNPLISKLQGRTLSNTAPSSGQVLTWNGTQWLPTTPISGLGGTGTSGYLPKFTGGTTIGNSILFEDAGKLAINRSNALYQVDIGTTALSDNFMRLNSSARAGIFFYDASLTGGGMFYEHNGDFLQFTTTDGTNYNERMRITSTGRLGIGTTNPLGKIHVASHGMYAGYFSTDTLGPYATGIYAECKGINNFNTKAFYGKSYPGIGYGYGGVFEGGYIGCYGYNDGGSYSGICKGINGYSGGTAGTRYGVFGAAGGGTTNYGVYSSGDLGYTGNLIGPSDIKLKENITPINSGILEKIMLLQPKKYSYKTDSKLSNMNLPKGMHYGLIAQELEIVFPELVKDAVHPAANESLSDRSEEPIRYKGVVMTELIPILIEAFKEQQQEIEQLKARLDKLEQK